MSATTRRRRGVIATSSWLAIGLALAGGEAALAQQASSDTSDVADVVVTGTRASLQSAINRKRAAATNVDSIVAEDVAAFPDKNVGEALQRVTGVSLTRDFGEGSQISIRGVEPDLNRVEINGLSVLANAGTGARGANLQELASELVASIDVFKGFTADMTEGGVGGTVAIRTLKPLDLRKDMLVVTGSAQYLDSTEDTRFRGNVTAGKTFWDKRLGVLVNLTYNDAQLRGDFVRNTLWTRFNNTEPARTGTTFNGQVASGDYDNSPDKTYVDQNYADITRKEDCPVLAANANNPCLNQWNEHVPAIPRYGMWIRNDKRISGQATLEYRVSDNLRAFVEYTLNNQDNTYTDFDYQFQADAQHRINAVTYDRFGRPITRFAGSTAPYPYATPMPVVVDADHNLIDFYLAPNANNVTGTAAANQGSAGAFRTTNRDFQYDLKSEYLQAGFNWKSDHLNIDGIVATSESHNIDDTNFLNYQSNIPNIHVALNPENGIPQFTPGPGFDFNDPASITQFARNAAGQPVRSVGITVQYQPKETDATEDTAKLDVDWYLDGFINKVEFGYQGRKLTTLRYDPNGYITYAPGDTTRTPIYVQGARVNYNADLDPNATTTGAVTYPFITPPITSTAVSIVRPTTQADILAFMQEYQRPTPGTFFNGGPYQGFDLPTGWFSPDATRIFEGNFFDADLDTSTFAPDFPRTSNSLYTHDFVRRSIGRYADGSYAGIFDQTPNLDTEEIVNAVYGQVSFEGDLYGMTLKGNSGVRIIQSEVNASGAISEVLRSASVGGAPTVLSSGRTVITTINKKYTDALPTFNLSLDITDKLVARFGYAKLLARPKISQLVPNGNCTFNDITTGTDFQSAEDTCTLGNPGLNPYRASSYDVSIGYYYNRDTLINVAAFYKKLDTFILGSQLVRDYDVFGDGRLIDVTMPVNGSGATQKGLEITAQTAFTWLPAPFDGLGVQANYTLAKADNTNVFDALTGEELTQAGLSRDTYNLVVYYDKGPINARIAYNHRTPYFTGGGSAGTAGRREGTEYVDGKFTYEFSPHLSAFIEGQNLTGEIETSFAGSIRVNERSFSGKRFFVGATYKY
jgi:TonB-dependent receptor